MSTKDDALIEKIEDSIRHSLHWSLSNRETAERVLTIARKEILEEAANVASANEDKYQNPTEYDYGAQICSREIAAAIRSLATQEQPQ